MQAPVSMLIGAATKSRTGTVIALLVGLAILVAIKNGGLPAAPSQTTK